MTKKPLFKVIASLIITAIFSYLMYMLVDAVRTGLFFDPETTRDTIIVSAALIGGPVIIAIICSIIRKRALWALTLANQLVCCILGAAMGEETTMAHAYVYGLMVIIPYIFCLIMLLKEKKEYKPAPSPSTGGYSSDSGYNSYASSLTYSQKEAYILKNCHAAYSYTGIQTIENDPNLTSEQKEDLKNHLRIYGD